MNKSIGQFSLHHHTSAVYQFTSTKSSCMLLQATEIRHGYKREATWKVYAPSNSRVSVLCRNSADI